MIRSLPRLTTNICVQLKSFTEDHLVAMGITKQFYIVAILSIKTRAVEDGILVAAPVEQDYPSFESASEARDFQALKHAKLHCRNGNRTFRNSV